MTVFRRPALFGADPAIITVLLFWVAEYAVVTTVDHLALATALLFLPRALIALVGLIVSLGLLRLRTVFRSTKPAARLFTMMNLALIGAVAQHLLVTNIVFRFFAPDMQRNITVVVLVSDVLRWLWVFVAELGIVFSLDLAALAISRERQIAALSRTGHEAQMRALRYQLNPHFLFNTLNSLAALVQQRRNDAAEAMIENLADFVRATLAIRPDEELTLDEEWKLTQRYLAIELVRYPERMAIRCEIADEVLSAMVPGLILQPLVENVVRHAIAQNSSVIEIRIAARAKGGQLALSVVNDLPPVTIGEAGFGVGLSNVRDRLRAHYGDAAQMDVAAGGSEFAVTILLPLRRRS